MGFYYDLPVLLFWLFVVFVGAGLGDIGDVGGVVDMLVCSANNTRLIRLFLSRLALLCNSAYDVRCVSSYCLKYKI